MYQPRFQPMLLLSPKLCWILIITSISLLTAGCGSSSKSSQTLSPAQAQAISNEVVTALQGALTSVSGGLPAARAERRSLATALHDANPAQSSDCTTNSNGTACNIPIAYSGSCPGGGTIGVAGDLIFTLDNSGNGSDAAAITVTPANCSVSNLTLNGDPAVVVATQFKIANDQLQFPMTFTETGGISYGPNPAGSCLVNVSLTISSQTSCTVSGSLCGQSVNGSC